VINHSLRQNGNGEPVWTIRITGGHDIFRFAFHSIHGQVEFCEMGTGAFRYLRRRWGVKRFKLWDQRMTSGKVVEGGYHRDRVRD
jgi:hypothetical protein